MLNKNQIVLIEQQLHHIKSQILGQDSIDFTKTSFKNIAGEVHDSGDESVAREVVGLNAVISERQTQELSDIDAALQRIFENSYGVCVDCGIDIEFARLQAFPMAKRCIKCKLRHEQDLHKNSI